MLLPIFLKDKEPVLYVGNEVLDDYGAFAQSEEKRQKLDECNELGREWLKKRSVVKLDEFEMHPHALNGMVVYWVEGSEEAKVGARNEEGDVGRVEEKNARRETGTAEEG